jgi:hypothetical protein
MKMATMLELTLRKEQKTLHSGEQIQQALLVILPTRQILIGRSCQLQKQALIDTSLQMHQTLNTELLIMPRHIAITLLNLRITGVALHI